MHSVNHVGLFLFLLLMLAACPLLGQVTSKKTLTPEDYHRWSTLIVPQISSDGQWVSFTKHYDYGQDTLFVQSVTNKTQFIYPGKGRLKFSANGRKAIIQNDSILQIQDLNTGEVEHISPILRYELTQKGKYLLILKAKRLNNNTGSNVYDLVIKDLIERKSYALNEVDLYVVGPEGNTILFTTQNHGKYKLHFLNMAKKQWELSLLRESDFPFKQLVWGPSGKSFAFLQAESLKNMDLSLHFYKDLPKSEWFSMASNGLEFGVDSLRLANSMLIISKDDQKIFFKAISELGNSEVRKQAENEIIEIWHSQDKIIYPRRKVLGLGPHQPLTWVWWPETNRTMKLGTFEQPYIVITPNFDHVVSYNLWNNEPLFKRDADLDFSITDLDTEKKQLLVDKLAYQGEYLTMSEDGHYLKYFKNGDWWIYNIEKQKHINLTKGLEIELSELDFDNSEDVIAYGSPGWSNDGNSILIYDQYDIWQFSLDGNKRKRLTKGREQGIKYRIDELATHENQELLFPSLMDKNYDLGKGLVLEAKGDNLNSGYYLWGPVKGLQAIVYKPKRVYSLKKANNTQDYVYLEESFEEPTRLVFLKTGEIPRTLVISNAFQSEYAFGKSTLIDYKNKEGNILKGVLVYPANYNPGHKYPMVVNIYEKQLYKFNQAIVPSVYKKNDYLNPTVFAAKGYFVLYPNIVYTIGKPGESALDCVVSAVNKVIDMGVIDSRRIGLCGVSYGGFETNYIISQTDIFTTAVSGVAINDFLSRYLSVNVQTGLDEAWRYEHHQLRMGNSFTDDFENFLDNSPVHHAASINTPLLAWVGKKDPSVPWSQSVEMYLALRRLGKKHVLLVYPDEKHVIMKRENQRDLIRRMCDWFDYYLKGSPLKQWMVR